MKQFAITLIELPATLDGRLYGAMPDDVYSLVHLPSRATDLLAAICRKAGYADVEAINPEYNKVCGKFTLEQMKRIISSDVVGISTITRTANQSYELADHIKSINPDVKIVIGGPHTSALPEEALEHVDFVVMNEGDHTFIELLDHLENETDPFLIKGIAFKDFSGKVIRTEKRPFLTNEELDALPFPVYPREVLNKISHAVINTSRGCPYACEYCAVIENFGRRFRFTSVERTVESIKHTLNQARKKIFFGDDNFTAIPKRSKALLEAILKSGIKMPPWIAQVRVETARDIELLKLMKRAGCQRVCIGFESVNEATLKSLNKESTLEKNTFAIRRFHEARISIHGMFIVGADDDTKSAAMQTVEYAKKNRIDTLQLVFMVPLPGTKMTQRLEKTARIISREWHRYDGQHVLVQPKNMKASELHELTSEAWRSFYSIREAIKHLFYGNEHWFNCLVRIWGRKIVEKIIDDSSYYRRALTSLESWHDHAVKEYDAFSAKLDSVAKDRHAWAKTEAEKIIQKLSERKDLVDEQFSEYKEKFLAELHQMMLSRIQVCTA